MSSPPKADPVGFRAYPYRGSPLNALPGEGFGRLYVGREKVKPLNGVIGPLGMFAFCDEKTTSMSFTFERTLDKNSVELRFGSTAMDSLSGRLALWSNIKLEDFPRNAMELLMGSKFAILGSRNSDTALDLRPGCQRIHDQIQKTRNPFQQSENSDDDDDDDDDEEEKKV